MYSLKEVMIALSATVLSSCCIFVGPCTNIESSPTVRWEDESGAYVQMGTSGLNVLKVGNLFFDSDSIAVWEVDDSFGGSEPTTGGERILSIIDAGEIGALPSNGERRNNEIVITYSLNSVQYVDTLFYASYLEESGCCTTSRIEPIERVSGPLVRGFRTTTDLPGVIIVIDPV